VNLHHIAKFVAIVQTIAEMLRYIDFLTSWNRCARVWTTR